MPTNLYLICKIDDEGVAQGGDIHPRPARFLRLEAADFILVENCYASGIGMPGQSQSEPGLRANWIEVVVDVGEGLRLEGFVEVVASQP